MKEKTLLIFAFIFLLIPAITLSGFPIAEVASTAIHIKSDGSIEPALAPIQRDGDTYILKADIDTQGISIEKAAITLDGAGHTITGPYNGQQTLWIIGEGPNQVPTNETFWMGLNIVSPSISGLTIKNLNIKNFSIGIWLWSPNNIVIGNSITNGIVGVLLEGDRNIVTQNYVANNKYGVYFGSNQPADIPNITLTENSFVENIKQLSGCVCVDLNTSEPVHTWDNGKRGNFWSDYHGVDSNKDGVGDTPYIIDVLNEDRYPLMESPLNSPTPNTSTTIISTPNPIQVYPIEWHLIAATVVAVAIAAVVAVWIWRRKKGRTLQQSLGGS